jgi:hypothetical protein
VGVKDAVIVRPKALREEALAQLRPDRFEGVEIR